MRPIILQKKGNRPLSKDKDGDANKTRVGGSKDRFWYPRIWDGMTLRGWLRVLAKNRMAIAPSRLVMAAIISAMGPINSGLGLLQNVIYGRKIRKTEFVKPPIFVVGHWRSGTTLLHEYLVRDQRNGCANAYMCFCPAHFLVSWSWLRPAMRGLLPPKRPMDNMAFGWERPQEDEFALCNLGAPSPYLMMTFPNRTPMDQDYLDLEDAPKEGLARWKRVFDSFLRAVSYHERKRIVLKSPTHTARMKMLADMFPGARFIHIHRDPYAVYPSTVHLWMRLSHDEGLQHPKPHSVDERVFKTFNKMYDAFHRDREQLDANQITDVRYEDLVERPVEELERIYRELELDDFEEARGAIEAFAGTQKRYKKNKYDTAPETLRRVEKEWGWFFDKYDYPRLEESDLEPSEEETDKSEE